MSDIDWDGPVPCAKDVLGFGARCLCLDCRPTGLRAQVEQVLVARASALNVLPVAEADPTRLDSELEEFERIIADVNAWVLRHLGVSPEELWCDQHDELTPCLYCEVDTDEELAARLTAPIDDPLHDVEL